MMLLPGVPRDKRSAKSVPVRRKKMPSVTVRHDVSVVNANVKNVNARRRKKKKKGNRDELQHVVHYLRHQVHVDRHRQLLICLGAVAEMKMTMVNQRK